MMGKPWRQACEGISHLTYVVRRQKEVNVGAQLTLKRHTYSNGEGTQSPSGTDSLMEEATSPNPRGVQSDGRGTSLTWGES